MSEHTLSYSKSVEGFPSFYSFIPDFMKGMNQSFFSWKGGDLYIHNSDSSRNTFYGQSFESSVTSVFNDSPLENKQFLTLDLEGLDSWEADLSSDIQTKGRIEDEWFDKKEGNWFSYIRNNALTEELIEDESLELRNLRGVGNSLSVSGSGASILASFPLSVDFKEIISVDDLIYFTEAPNYDTPIFAGKIVSFSVDKSNNINQIEFDSTVSVNTVFPTAQDVFFFIVKNPVAESTGILGSYCEFKLTLPVSKSTQQTELFAVNTKVFKSNP